MERIFVPRVVDSNAEGAVDREVARVAAARRKQAGIDADPHGAWGLALSGGGIRSATFCLGLVRGLAKNKLLRQIDFLSTVSGGGYLGTSLGRLYGEGADAKAVEAGVASNNSMWLWWLRNNGRYLTPAGAKDLVYATASIFRGVIATHLEIGILLLLLGLKYPVEIKNMILKNLFLAFNNHNPLKEANCETQIIEFNEILKNNFGEKCFEKLFGFTGNAKYLPYEIVKKIDNFSIPIGNFNFVNFNNFKY